MTTANLYHSCFFMNEAVIYISDGAAQVCGLKRRTHASSLGGADGPGGKEGAGAAVKYIWIRDVVQCLRVASGKAQMYIRLQ